MPQTNHARTARAKAEKKISHRHKPPEMSLEEWQRRLRSQFGREQKFKMLNAGAHPVFSDFQVTNPQSGNTYRVSIRGREIGQSHCTCADFKTNALGTCKHIEFALARLERKPETKRFLKAGYHPAYSEITLQYGAQRSVKFVPGTDCPPKLAVLAAEHFDEDLLLPKESFGRFDRFLAEASGFDHDLRCHEDALGFIAEVRDRDQRALRIDKLFPLGADSPDFDTILKVPLYAYQRQGALFAVRAGRALIGDEMGLGKTIQALAAAEIMARHLGVERALIVCPTSLKHQWEREIEKFTGRSAQVVGGMRTARQQAFQTSSFFKIINYDTVHADLDLIQNWSPDLVILDEAQRIKNWSTRTARSVKKIVSPFAIVLTGTPLENRLEELVSIVQFIDQHRLGPTFKFLAEHQVQDEHGKVVGYRDLDTIGKTLSPILIRRRKDQVLKQLPERLDKNLFVPMTPEQLQHHNENKEIVSRIVSKWKRYKFLSESDQRRLMIALQNMRMSCDSTYLLDQETDFGIKADELATQLEDLFETPDTKVVIFSQWLRMHEVLLKRFKERKWNHVLFHGGVPGTQRRGLVDRFREDESCRAFLATDAGGVGLNLQWASVVVNMDLPWNPAVLEQRIGRVHRLGQKRPVQVINFVAQGTIEEGMLSTLKFKKSLFAGALDGGEKEVFMGGSRLTRFMQTVEQTAGSIPAAMTQESSESSVEETGFSTAASMEEPLPSKSQPSQSTQPAGDPWSGLLQTGLSLLEQLAGAARQGPSTQPAAPTNGLSIVRTDERTGEQFLRLPMPSPDVLQRILGAVGDLLGKFRA